MCVCVRVSIFVHSSAAFQQQRICVGNHQEPFLSLNQWRVSCKYYFKQDLKLEVNGKPENYSTPDSRQNSPFSLFQLKVFRGLKKD